MINILDIFLLKGEETIKLRNSLKNLKFYGILSGKSSTRPLTFTEESDEQNNYFVNNTIKKEENNKKRKNIFEILFTTWCLNPISCINLCFLCENYELSYYLIQKM